MSVMPNGVDTMTVNAFPFLAAEEVVRDHQATDALFLTFNADLGFFESRLLGILRASGACATVVADASVWSPDLRAVQHAGRSYHLGLMASRRAFHPKLMVLVGPRRAIATVGSGNLTLGGWQYNAELLTAFTGDTDGMPTAFGDISRTLKALDGLDPLTANAVGRVTAGLDKLLAAAPPLETPHRVVSSWEGPLIEQLPTGPVAEVLVSAAFHDPASEALRRVLERMQPARVRVAVQPGWTHLNVDSLRRVLDRYATATGADVAVVADVESREAERARYRHGKLIEWVTPDGDRWAMTGSPNLSTVALLRSVEDDGNHELAVVGPVTDTLFPGSEPLDWADVPTVTGDHETAMNRVQGAPVLTFAARTDTGMTIRLAAPTSVPVRVDLSEHAESPDDWLHLTDLNAGDQQVDLPVSPAAGSRVRVAWKDETGTVVVGDPVFVSDPSSVQRRPLPTVATTRAQRAVAVDLFGEDIALLNALNADFAALAQDLAQSHGPTITRDATGVEDGSGDRMPSGPEQWLWAQDNNMRRFGSDLGSWALGLQRLDTGTTSVAWADKVTDDSEAGLEDDTDTLETDVTLGDDPDAQTEPVDHSNDIDRLKAARRRFAKQVAEHASVVPLPSRLFMLRLVLTFWSAGNWPEDDPEPLRLIEDLINRAIEVDANGELADRAGSLTAVAVAMLRQRSDFVARNNTSTVYKRVVESAAHMLAAVDPDAVEQYVIGLRNAYDQPLDASTVEATVATLLEADPLADLHEAMESDGHNVTRPATNHMVVRGDFSNPTKVALEALATVEDLNNIAIWAESRGQWALVTWSKPDLVTVWTFAGRERWRHQRLRPPVGPAAIANMTRTEGAATPFDLVAKPKHARTDAAAEVLVRVGVEGPTRPS